MKRSSEIPKEEHGLHTPQRIRTCCFTPSRSFPPFIGVSALLLGITLSTGCVLLQHPNESSNLLPSGQQPDKILYEKSVNEIDHGRYDVGRLMLQSLLNTYPDSEYLAKAKLAIANSYFQQGGVSGLTESEAEYKDFITFFPTAPEAPMAQYRVGMAHFRLMGKADRDNTEALLAEAEFKEFLLRYPDSPLMPRVKGRLREVQEVLAQGEYEIAHLYYEKHANLAARSRFEDVVNRYPSFSLADQACWSLAETYRRLKNPKAAIPYYRRIITDFPLSSLVPEAKAQLVALHQPIPQPTMATLIRARADAMRDLHQNFFQKFMGTFSSSPNLSATRHGPVILEPEKGSVEMAKNPQPGESSGSSIAVQPVNETALKSGKAVDPQESGSTASKAKAKTNSKKKTESDADRNTEASAASKKKSGHFHIFKKVVKPF